MSNQNNNLEQLLDLIAEALIESPLVSTPTIVEGSQKYIRNGTLQQGSGEGVLALFQKEVKANQEDLNQNNNALLDYANEIDFESDVTSFAIEIQPSNDYSSGYKVAVISNQNLSTYDITNYVQSHGDEFSSNPLNVSQFIPLKQLSSIVDVEKAEEYLDTNIFELLPTGDTRQARIIRFFQELNALLPPSIDDSDWDSNNDGRVDREQETDNWEGTNQYNQDNSISYAQDNQDGNIDEEDAFIHRLTDTANDTNSTRTIEEIYNRVRPYLRDILEDPILPQDDRPEYENQSSGYLQFRNLNQGIIIRNTNQDFIEGLDPNNLTFLETGFTISMWVKFLDKVSEGTLFNFGNPLREDNPFGFKLETYVLKKDDPTFSGTWGSLDLLREDSANSGGLQPGDIYLSRYENSNTARYVRLVINDNAVSTDGITQKVLRDSHTGMINSKKNYTIPIIGGTTIEDNNLASTTFIPEDFNEWYFICASFNPAVDEEASYTGYNPSGGNVLGEDGQQSDPIDPAVDLSHSTNYWLNHINPSDGSFTNFSNFGNRCKVEIISRSDLLRARGFKVD